VGVLDSWNLSALLPSLNTDLGTLLWIIIKLGPVLSPSDVSTLQLHQLIGFPVTHRILL